MAVIWTLIPWVRLLAVCMARLVLLLTTLVIRLRLSLITFVNELDIWVFFSHSGALILDHGDLGGFTPVNSLRLVPFMLLVYRWWKINLLLLWVNLVVWNDCPNHTSNIIFVYESFENYRDPRQFSVIRIIVPVYSWNRIFRLKQVSDWWVVNYDDIFEVSAKPCQVLDKRIIVVSAMLPEQFVGT